MRMKKRKFFQQLFSILLSAVLIFGCMRGFEITAGAVNSVDGQMKMIVTDGVTLDGDLSDWEGVEKHKVQVRQEGGTFVESTDEFVQYAVSPDSIYVALTLNDDEKTLDSLTRDHVRLGIILPNGEIGLAYYDCDTWTFTRDGATEAFPNWWLNEAGQYNAFIPDNSTSIFSYADGKVTVELRACLDASMRAQLVDGAVIRFCVTYYDGWEINANTFNGCDMKTYGTTANFFGNGEGIDALLELDDGTETPEQGELPWEGEDALILSLVEADPVTLDGDLSDWADVETHNLAVLQDGIFVESEDETVQFIASPDSIYVALTLNDDEKTLDSLTRDHVRLGIILPNGEIGLAYYDCDTWTFTRNGNTESFPDWWLNAADQYNAFIVDNSTSVFSYADGKVTVELRACLDASMREQLVDGAELQFCVTYYDGWEINANTFNGCDMKTFGTTANFFGNGEGIDAVLELDDGTEEPVQGPLPWEGEDAIIIELGETDPVTLDGDLSDWADVETHNLAVLQNGIFVESEDETVQFIASPDSIYVALSLSDDEMTKNDLTRDHVRLGIILPNGEIGLAYYDCDTWTFVRTDGTESFPAWWLNADGQYNAFIPDNSTSVFNYADGRVTVELRACLDSTMRAQLVDGAEIKFCVTYYDGWEINSNIHNGCDMKTFGTTKSAFGNGEGIDAVLEIEGGEVPPVQGPLPWEGEDAIIIDLGETDPVTVDGDLSDWADVAKHNLAVLQNGIFVESEDEFVQFIASPDSIYVALTVNDDEKTYDGLTRDHIRLGVILPNGEIGLAYYDCDNWTFVRSDGTEAFPAWWLNADGQYNPFIPDNSTSVISYADGKATVELRACLDPTMRAQLVDGAQIKFCVTYYDGWEINANTFNGCDMKTFGTTANFFGNGEGIDALLELDDGTVPPVQGPLPWEGEDAIIIDLGETDPVTVDGDLSDWADVEKHNLAVLQNGIFVESEDETVQFIASPDSIYVALTLNDDEKTIDGLTRDHVRLGIILPNGEIGLAYYDADGWTFVRSDGTEAFPDWWLNANGQYNAFIPDNSTGVLSYADGKVTVELRACLDSTMRAQFVDGAQIKFCVTYYDGWEINANTFNGCDMKTFGTTANFFGNGEGIDALLELDDGTVPPVQGPLPWEGEDAIIIDLGETDPVTVDGDLSDWTDIESHSVAVLQNGIFVESEDEFVQFIASPDSIYVALTLNDDEMTKDSLTRDHVRLGIILPNGEIGLAYFDCDTWTFVRSDGTESFPDWWLNEADQYNAFIADNSTSVFTYADGKVTVELRACLDSTMRAQLVDGAQIKFCVTYYDGWEINSNIHNGCDMKTFGTTKCAFGNGTGIDAVLELDDGVAPVQGELPWEGEGTIGIELLGAEPVILDGDLSDWADVEKHNVAVRQANGIFEESEDEFVQFIVSPDSIYVALTLNDDEKTFDGLTRDHVRLGVILPNGEIGLAYYDCDTWAFIRQDGTEAFPDWWMNANGQYNPFIPNLSQSVFTYADGKVTVELRACLDESMRAQIEKGAQIKFCVTYYDGWEINANTFNGCDMKTFGTTANFFGNGEGIDATLTVQQSDDGPEPGALPWAGQTYNIKAVETDPVQVDGDLSDWAGIEKHNMVVRQQGGVFAESSDEYVQFIVSPDSIYVALTLNDAGKTFNDLTRDHVRLGIILPNGEIGLAYFDCDTWTYTRLDEMAAFPDWWLNAYGQYNPFIPDNSRSTFNYQNGKVIVELRACLDESMRAQIEKGAQIKFCVTYYDGWEINANAYNGCGMKTFGTTANFFGNGQGIDATLVVQGDKPAPPVQPNYTYEATSVAGGPEMDIVLGTTTDLANNFWEWFDDPDGLWSEPEKHPMAVYQKGVYVMSSDQYIQFKYTYGQLYFRIHVKDADGKTANGLIRDGVFVTVVFPNGDVGSYFFGTDADDSLAWLQWGVEAWFDESKTGEEYQALSAFTNNNSMPSFYFANGYADVEFRVTVKDAYRDYFVNGTKLKVAVSYRDRQTVNSKSYEGGNWAVWGTTECTTMDLNAITGVVTLVDPNYRDTSDMELLDPTPGAENAGYGFDADGNLIAEVKPTEGAETYRINVFDRWDDAMIPNTWEESDSTRLIVGGLVADTDMTYQVVAYDADGNVIAVYPPVDFVVGEDPEIPDEPDTPTEGNTEENQGTENEEPGSTAEPGSTENNGSNVNKNKNVVPLIIGIVAGVALIALVIILLAKKRKEKEKK